MSKITFFKNDAVEQPVALHSLGVVNSLKLMEFSEDNFQDVPDTVMIKNILDPVTFDFKKPSEKDSKWEGVSMEHRPFDRVKLTVMNYDKFLETKEAYRTRPELADLLQKELRTFDVWVRYDVQGVGEFAKIVDKAKERAEKENLKRPVLLLKGCHFAFVPKWEMNSNQYKEVSIILKGIDGLEVLEEPVIKEEEETQDNINIDDLFD